MIYIILFSIVLVLILVMGLQISNEVNYIKRLMRTSERLQHLLDYHQYNHIDLIKSVSSSSIPKQLRILEYYLHHLDNNFTPFTNKGSQFHRLNRIDQRLAKLSSVHMELA